MKPAHCDLLSKPAASSDMKAALSDIISKAPGTAKPRVVVEGFPTNVDQANKFESEVGHERNPVQPRLI